MVLHTHTNKHRCTSPRDCTHSTENTQALILNTHKKKPLHILRRCTHSAEHMQARMPHHTHIPRCCTHAGHKQALRSHTHTHPQLLPAYTHIHSAHIQPLMLHSCKHIHTSTHKDISPDGTRTASETQSMIQQTHAQTSPDTSGAHSVHIQKLVFLLLYRGKRTRYPTCEVPYFTLLWYKDRRSDKYNKASFPSSLSPQNSHNVRLLTRTLKPK